MTKVTVSHQ